MKGNALWAIYRHGKPTAPKTEAIFKGAARKPVISRVMDVMRDWRSTPFENEGSTIAGLRSGLCSQGYGWASADREARSIVADCLRYLGAVRPNWDQGQPEFTVSDENCKWCSAELPPEASEGLRQFRFCSTECAKAAIAQRSADNWLRNSNIAWSAYRMVLKSRMPQRVCEACGIRYSTVREKSESKYCSKACYNKGRLKYVPKTCPTCKQGFQPIRATSVYCSVACKHPKATIVLTPRLFDRMFKQSMSNGAQSSEHIRGTG
ncbi:hypothetical protein JVX98_19370 [Ensifer sp. PDNC004]|uniref:hypothetical protein n=1 Tax=Ensifer sp. PDNC004 TaxID=2811423 RepID=UPI0019642BE9|nr:hypothetical protein [Ensifer sp. PDNC004]QRY66557.1 hypothetical protein JVX98_19370 [Ensifer sp. PDNC004]